MILSYKGITPRIGENVFIAPTAVVIGDVTVNDGASIWFNAVIRGDMEYVRVGYNTNIQDNCVVHTDHGYPVLIGDNVTIGHNAVVHGCTIKERVLVGMSSVILNGAIIEKFSVVAAGTIVLQKQHIGPYHLVTGSPAVYKKTFSKNIEHSIEKSVLDYLDLSKNHMKK